MATVCFHVDGKYNNSIPFVSVSSPLTMQPIYLDYNATTPIDPLVRAAMTPYFETHFGNPSSSHVYGQEAQRAVACARSQVANLLGAEVDEIVFTGGGSEANNQAIKGTVLVRLQSFVSRIVSRRAHIITTAIEHPATLQPCDFLKRLGVAMTVLPVDGKGCVDPDAVRKAIRGNTALITVMHSNNEVGTLQPIREIAAIARQHRVLMHTDAAQSLGKVPIDVKHLGVDLLSVAGHKMYAPKGVGALYVRRGVAIEALVHGAGHEHGRRAGTENVPYLAGLGVAAEIAAANLPQASEKLRTLRDRLERQLRAALGDRIVLNGAAEQRLPNTLNVNFLGCIGSRLLERVPEVAASTGSACHEGTVDLSPVLCAMGVPRESGRGAVRLTVGRFTTEDEIDRAVVGLVRGASKSD